MIVLPINLARIGWGGPSLPPLAWIVAMHPIGNGQPAPTPVAKSTRKAPIFQSLSFCGKSQISYG
jgi:hypothetical protein